IRRHGGEVEKNIGDAIMAVFGRIRAREDDALRAVRAEHGMRQGLADLNDEFQRFYGVQVTNRDGVNTGEMAGHAAPAPDQSLASGAGIPFWPLVEIVRNAATILEDDSTDAARERIAALLPDDDPDREGVVDRVVSAMGLSARDFPVTEIFWGARRLLERL